LRKSFKIGSVILASSLLCQTFAFAQNQSVTVNKPKTVGSKITISGVLPQSSASELVTIQVVSPGFELGDMEGVYHIREVEVAEDKSFTYDFLMTDVDFRGNSTVGRYTVFAGGKDVEVSELTLTEDGDPVQSFYFVPSDERKSVVQRIDDCTDANILETLDDEDVKSTMTILGIFQEEFAALGEKQDKVLDVIVSKNFQMNENLFYRTFNGAVLMQMIDGAQSYQEALEILRPYADFSGFDYARFDSLKEAELTALEKKNITKTDFDEWIGEVEDQIALVRINTEKSYQNIWDAITSVQDRLSLDEDDVAYFEALKNQTKLVAIKKALTNKNFATIQAVNDAFETAIADSKKSTSENGGNGGGGGGGGGGSYVSPSASGLGALVAPTGAKEQEEEVFSFSDVPESHWAYQNIMSLYHKGAASGANGMFEPDSLLTREAFVTLLVRGMKIPMTDEAIAFADVNAEDWFQPYVAAAKACHIVSGVSDSAFGVGQYISREDMAAMMYRAAVYCGILVADGETDVMFSDDEQIATYAREAVYSMKNMGIINGMGENSYQPDGVSTKAQAARIIDCLSDLLA